MHHIRARPCSNPPSAEVPLWPPGPSRSHCPQHPLTSSPITQPSLSSRPTSAFFQHARGALPEILCCSCFLCPEHSFTHVCLANFLTCLGHPILPILLVLLYSFSLCLYFSLLFIVYLFLLEYENHRSGIFASLTDIPKVPRVMCDT